MFSKKTVRDAKLNQKALVRTMLNVPIKDNRVTDKARLEAALPTLKYLLDNQVGLILISHHSDETQSLGPVAPVLSELLNRPIEFVADIIGPVAAAAVEKLQPGQMLMLENLRFNPGETANDPAFAKSLASYAPLFVEDDFTTCHREHASIVGVPKYSDEAVAGLALQTEVSTITEVIENPKRPVVAVLGGAKISTKLPILDFMLAKVDAVFIGGAMANTFLLAQGHEVGKSLVEADQVDLAEQIIAKAEQSNKKLLLPLDVVVTDNVTAASNVRTVELSRLGADDIIADIGPKSAAQLNEVIDPSGSVIWNGPVGIFETAAFASGSQAVAESIIKSGAYSLVGGGDTLSFIDSAGLSNRFSFVSTGGGASLELMSGHTLPGVEVLQDK